MYKSTHLGEIMETTCSQCKSRFRLTEKQLQQAYGKVRCGECGCVFNALHGLQNYEGELPPDYYEQLEDDISDEKALPVSDFDDISTPDQPQELSLHEAMYGSERRSFFSIGPLGWFIGILLLGAIGIAQAIYYQPATGDQPVPVAAMRRNRVCQHRAAPIAGTKRVYPSDRERRPDGDRILYQPGAVCPEAARYVGQPVRRAR
jgi:predicted Zn finger-like uncharacterized protein